MLEMTMTELIELIEALAAELNQRARGQSGSTPERGGRPFESAASHRAARPPGPSFLNRALRGVTLHAPAHSRVEPRWQPWHHRDTHRTSTSHHDEAH